MTSELSKKIHGVGIGLFSKILAVKLSSYFYQNVAVEYISESEVEEFMWHSAPIAIQLNDGHWIYPSKDDEGNDGGAMFTTYTKLPCIPVI